MSIMRTLTINGVKYDVTPVLPSSSVTLLANAWVGEEDSYYQIVELSGVTEHTKVDLQPTAEQLVEFHHKVLGFVAENDNRVVTVYAIGDKPAGDHTIQITLTEVEASGKIRGNTVGTTMPRSDLNQTDPKKADYVKGRERIITIEEEIASIKADVYYQDIAITLFACPGAGKTYEMGQSVAAPPITWSLNKEPASQSLNGESLGVDVRSKAYSGNITSNKTYTLTVTGQKGETAKQSGSYTFYNGVYYGLLADGATIDSAAILTLNKKVQGSRGVTFTATPTSAMRIAYAIPASGYGTPVFKDAVSGFQVDMYRLDDPIQFENEHGYVTAYYVWLSTNLLEKEITVSVT